MSFIAEFNKIDMEKYWLSPYFSIHQSLKIDIENHQFDDNSHLYEWLNAYFKNNHINLYNYHHTPLSFTHQNDLPHSTAYELFIAQDNKIPTRDNLHDWFNACIWSVFKQSKAILNHHHLLHIDKNDSGNKRNKIRDAITVFDENGIVLAISNDTIGKGIKEHLFNFDWQNSLVNPRAFWYNPNQNHQTYVKSFLFGHALLEQLILPRKNLCGHSFAVFVENDFFNWDKEAQLSHLDTLLAKQLNDWLKTDTANPKDLQPLPVLGIPHFCDDQDDDFYNDKSVFRIGRIKKE